MKESVVYQRILAQGKAEGIRDSIILYASCKFGPPNDRQLNEVRNVEDIPSLNTLLVKVNRVANWDEMFKAD